MKSMLSIIFCASIALGLLSCEKTSSPSPTLPSTPTGPDLSGVYIGEAEISIEQTQWDQNGDQTEIILVDTLIIDTITVSALSLADSTFQIERASNFFSSFYDFEGEVSFSGGFTWNTSYVYDKNWITNLQFNPSKDSLSAYMLVADVFESHHQDSIGNVLYTYRKRKEYSIKAIR